MASHDQPNTNTNSTTQTTRSPDDCDQYRHFLIVVQGYSSHINPAVHLAHRLRSVLPPTPSSCHVTVSTSISAHRKMFPSVATPDEEVTVEQVSFVPFSDGSEEEDDPSTGHDPERELAFAPKSLSAVIDRFMEEGRRVTCIIQALFLPWVVDLALTHSVPSVLYWIQPVTAFSVYYHYFNGYDSIVMLHKDDQDFTVNLPGLSPLKISDLPSFTTATPDDEAPYKDLVRFRGIFESLDRVRDVTGSKPKILINSFEALEPSALASMSEYFELYPAGPLIQSPAKDEERKNGAAKYMNWLDSKPENSVVYVSFGGLTAVGKRQLEEVQLGLKGSKVPYLWVVRKDSRAKGLVLEEDSPTGMIVEWCDQVRVLSHPSVGCFVTHHGWNSTLEGFMCGVPMIGIPQWSDQPTNAKLAAEIGVGVRGEVGQEENVVSASEIKRCLKLVMSDDDAKGTEMRRKARVWKENVTAAMATGGGGSSEKNLQAFVKAVATVTMS